MVFVLMTSLFVKTVTASTVVLAIMGIPWAIVLWIPFSLVGEFVSYEDEKRQQLIASAPSSSTHEEEEEEEGLVQDEFDAGMILGVHNMYIVFPQFAVAIVSSFIFAAADAIKEGEGKSISSVTPVLVFGGLMAFIAAAISRFIVRVTSSP